MVIMASSALLLCFLNLIFISTYYTVECTSPDSFPLDLEDLHPLIPLYMLKENRTERVLKGSSTSIKTNTKFIVNNKPPQDNYVSASTVSEISKTDMYLLNAIEKLAFRMEAMEKRLKTSEELIFQIMEGSNIKRQDACPANFTRVARNCYFFGDRMYNWKSAASMCKSMGSTLVEIESRDEFMEVVTYLQATNRLRGLEYWTGGLNPGLLWIWSSSARPGFDCFTRPSLSFIMADISKEDLKKEITAILKDADLSMTSAKKVRQDLEKKLDCDLSSRKKEVDDIVMAWLKESEKKGKKGAKKNGKTQEDEGAEEEEDEEEEEDAKDDEEDAKEEEDEEEEEEEVEEKPKRGAKKAPKRKKDSEESEEGSDQEKESDEEYSPSKKKAKAKPAKAGKGGGKGRKKKGSDSDSDEDWGKGKKGGGAKKGGGKRGGGGYVKACTLSPELAAIVGAESMARHEVVKKIWGIIKEKKLYDPKNKQYAICNDELMKVIGTKRFRTFGMMKYLKKHFVD